MTNQEPKGEIVRAADGRLALRIVREKKAEPSKPVAKAPAKKAKEE